MTIMSPTMSNNLHEDNICVVAVETSNQDVQENACNEEQEKMEQGELGSEDDPWHQIPRQFYPLPHHLRESCRAKAGMPCLRRSSGLSSSSSTAAETLSSLSSSTSSSGCTVRFFDEIEEFITTKKTYDASKQFKIKWPSATTEIRTRPRTTLHEKDVLFYTSDEIVEFKKEYRALVMASRQNKKNNSVKLQQQKQIDTFYQKGFSSRNNGIGMWGLTSTLSSIASSMKGVAKDVALALTASEMALLSSSTSSSCVSSSPSNQCGGSSLHMSMIDSMYIF